MVYKRQTRLRHSLLLLLCSATTFAQPAVPAPGGQLPAAQSDSLRSGNPASTTLPPRPAHAGKQWLVGAGATLIGVTGKGGRFVADRLWVGVQAEQHNFLSTRREAGAFGRYYTPYLRHRWLNQLSSFVEVGVSYGRFQRWDWDFDDEQPGTPPLYRSAKLNVASGLELAVTRRMSVEGVAKIGKLTNAGWWQPSFRCRSMPTWAANDGCATTLPARF